MRAQRADDPWAGAFHKTLVSLLPPGGLPSPLRRQTPGEKTLDEPSNRAKLDHANRREISEKLGKKPRAAALCPCLVYEPY